MTRRRGSIASQALPFALAAVCGACGARPGAVVPAESCLLVAETGAGAAGPEARPDTSEARPDTSMPDTLVLAVMNAPDATAAPVPRNESERLVFAQLYEGMVRLDCAGGPAPALAESWMSGEADAWTFTLRSGARFADGVPATAANVAAAWVDAREGGELPRRLAAFAALDERTLRVDVAEPGMVDPSAFADPALSVVRPAGGWPAGTGPFVADPAVGSDTFSPGSGEGSGGLWLLPRQPDAPLVEVRPLGTDDPRDALDAGADLLVTEDAGTLAYARTLPRYVVIPLPWDRVYVLVAPFLAARESAEATTSALAAALARDAVPVDARAPVPPFWWSGQPLAARGAPPPGFRAPASCTAPTASGWTVGEARGGRRRIVYTAGDATAAALAARLVALATDPAESDVATDSADALGAVLAHLREGAARPVIAGLTEERFETALAGGAETAYVLWLPRIVAAVCSARGALAAQLTGSDRGRGGARPVMIPLVETRHSAVLRKGWLGIGVAADGTPLLAGARWAGERR